MKMFQRRNRLMEKTQKTSNYLKANARVYKHANDKNVATYMVHSNGTNVFYDEGKTKKVGFEELQDLFLKGVIVKSATGFFTPLSMKVDATTVSIFIYEGSAAKELKSDTKTA